MAVMIMALNRAPSVLSGRGFCTTEAHAVHHPLRAKGVQIGGPGSLIWRRAHGQSSATLRKATWQGHPRPLQCSTGGAESAPPDDEKESARDSQEREVVDVMIASPSIEALTEMYNSATAQTQPSQQKKLGNGRRRARGRGGGGRGGGGLHWVLGPLALLVTGALPALWLPAPALFAGSATAGLLALTGLDATFNMGATAFLLMANSSANAARADREHHDEDDDDDDDGDGGDFSRRKQQRRSGGGIVTVPRGYKVWSFLVNFVGLAAPAVLLAMSARGEILNFQPGLHALPAAAMLGPYALLLVVQWLGEATLVWPWGLPVWPVVPLVYQAYRLLQLTRGLKLGAALDAPLWMVQSVKALVAWWVFVLGMQMMWVAWLVGTVQTLTTRRSTSTTH